MSFFLNNIPTILRLAGQHLLLSLTPLFISTLIALPLGWYLQRHPRLAGPVLGFFGVVYTIPSIALMILLIPLLGLNQRTVIAALILYTQIILLRNVLAGLNGIDPAVMEAARGMGMNALQIAWRVQLPLALPVILAGVRLAAVVSIAIATIGAKFGAGGLGTLLFDGLAQAGRMDKIWIGALSVAALAFLFNDGLQRLERRTSYRERLKSDSGA
ncbi:MAG TPA: ABC transporter permease [Bellilinea sp.]|jgi:osmoprotectant transport system permease protein|nr:ABC transporter permease [Bellilinea sp.]